MTNKIMTRDEMIEFLKENPNVKVRHDFFTQHEYIYSKTDGKIYAADDSLFEDWESKYCAGIRVRTGGFWENDWSLHDDYIKAISE